VIYPPARYRHSRVFRRRAVRLAEHRQPAHPQHLRQALCPWPVRDRAARPGAAAAGGGRPDAL